MALPFPPKSDSPIPPNEWDDHAHQNMVTSNIGGVIACLFAAALMWWHGFPLLAILALLPLPFPLWKLVRLWQENRHRRHLATRRANGEPPLD